MNEEEEHKIIKKANINQMMKKQMKIYIFKIAQITKVIK